MSSMQEDYEIFAFDIETNGALLGRNEILSAGYVFGDKHGNISEKGRVDFKSTTDFEKRCYDEFWSKYLDLYNELQKNALPQAEATRMFADVVDSHEKKNPLRVITDFAAFDPCWISWNFSKYLDRLPLYYTHDLKFRPIFDIDSYTRGVLKMDYENQWTDDNVIIKKYDLKLTPLEPHYPENDAQKIYELHIQLINKLNATN